MIVIATAGFCTAVVSAVLLLSAPNRGTVGPPPAGLIGAGRVGFPSASGSQLQGWWVPAVGQSRGIVVLMHGVRANRLQMATRAEILQRHNFSVLLFDFQAHGESPGQRLTFGKLEGLDAAAAVRFARSRAPGERVGVIGASLGGAAALLGRVPVDALVLEAVYPDITAAFENRLRVRLGKLAGTVLVPILTPAFRAAMPWLLGTTADALRPIDQIATISGPVLILSGTEDRYTPLAETMALYDHAAQPKQVWFVEGAGHVDLEHYNPARYWQVVVPFLEAALR